MEIRNGRSSTLAPLYGTFCGQSMPPNPIISRTNELLITFWSSQMSDNGAWFNASYQG